jgi:nucleotide-binding universal stress UspA family protein
MKILLPIDDSEPSRAAVATIIGQFRSADTEVRVLNVVEWPAGMPMSLRYAEGPTAAADLVASHRRALVEAETLTARAARQLAEAGFQTKAEVIEGTSRHAILDYAARRPADVIVIGSHGRKGVDRLLLGSVSEAVVRKAGCSVEVVRPARSTAEQLAPELCQAEDS